MKQQNQRSIFKPLVASSLAVALGVSVASATTGFYIDNGTNSQGNAVQFSGSTIGFGSSGTYDTFTIDGTTKNNMKIYFTSASNYWNNNQIELAQNSILKSSNGFLLNNDGSGTLTVDMWLGYLTQPRTFYLDLSNITAQTSSAPNYAIYGNLSVTGSNTSDGAADRYGNKTFYGLFGGKGIKGNVTLNALGNTKLTFKNNANIDGSLTINRGQNAIVFEGAATIGSGIAVSIPSGSNANGGINTITFNNNATISSGGIVYSAGTTSIDVKGDLMVQKSDGDPLRGSSSGIINLTANNITLKKGSAGQLFGLMGVLRRI